MINTTYDNILMGGMGGNLKTFFGDWGGEFQKHFPQKGKAYEVGAGDGNGIRFLKNELYNYTVASDVSNRSVEALKEIANEVEKLDIVEGRSNFIGKEQFHSVFALEVLEHVSSPYHAVKQMKELCKLNGTLHITIPDYQQQKGYDKHQHAFIYPGLFIPENFEIFLMQLYCKVVYKRSFNHPSTFSWYDNKFSGTKIRVSPLHHYYICENLHIDVDPIEIAAGDYDENEIYGWRN